MVRPILVGLGIKSVLTNILLSTILVRRESKYGNEIKVIVLDVVLYNLVNHEYTRISGMSTISDHFGNKRVNDLKR